MKTLILTLFLLLPLASIADVPCHVAIQAQHDSIDSLQQQLKTAQSKPYNQGYQEGYKVAKLEVNPLYKQVLEACGCIFIVLVFVGLILVYTFSQEKYKTPTI